MEYNSNGIRTRKGDTTYELDGGNIISETTNGNTIRYYYGNGGIVGFRYNGNRYYYEKNAQKDIIAIYDESGNLVGAYIYDTWGNVTITANIDGIASVNPFRYRCYYYDSDIGVYYLKSRYYDTNIGRFINADSLISTATGVLGYNMFAYCNDNPINMYDSDGHEPDEILDTDGDNIGDCYVYYYTYTVGILFWKETKTGKVYVYENVHTTDEFDNLTKPEGFNEKTDLLIGDRTEEKNPTLFAYQAHKIDSKYRSAIVDIMFEYISDYGKKWERTKPSVMTEWENHHYYAWASARAQNIDFDANEEGKGFWYFLWKAITAVIN